MRLSDLLYYLLTSLCYSTFHLSKSGFVVAQMVPELMLPALQYAERSLAGSESARYQIYMGKSSDAERTRLSLGLVRSIKSIKDAQASFAARSSYETQCQQMRLQQKA